MKVAIVGSRKFPNLLQVQDYIEHRMSLKDTLVSGGAEGVDTAAESKARWIGMLCKIYYPLQGESPMIRNGRIVKAADMVVAFWDGRSPGTRDSIERALASKTELHVYFPKKRRQK